MTIITHLCGYGLQAAYETGNLYAVIDACGHEMEIPGWAAKLGGDQTICLFDGQAGETAGLYAPYIFKVDATVRDVVLPRVWDDAGWGFFFITNTEDASVSLHSLRRHFKRWLRVGISENPNVLFRFYDPRILNGWLRALDNIQRTLFMGPMQSVVTAGANNATQVFLNPNTPSQNIRHPIGKHYQIKGRLRKALDRVPEEQSINDYLAYVKQHKPDIQNLPDYMQRGMVEGAIHAANTHGIENRNDLQQWVLMHFELGAEFTEEYAWAAAIVNNSQYSGTEKIKQLIIQQPGLNTQVLAENKS